MGDVLHLDNSHGCFGLGTLLRTGGMESCGLEVEPRGPTVAAGDRGACCDDAERACIPSSAFPPDCESTAAALALDCQRQNRPPTPLIASPGSEARPIRHPSLTARVMRLLGTSCLRSLRRPSRARPGLTDDAVDECGTTVRSFERMRVTDGCDGMSASLR